LPAAYRLARLNCKANVREFQTKLQVSVFFDNSFLNLQNSLGVILTTFSGFLEEWVAVFGVFGEHAWAE